MKLKITSSGVCISQSTNYDYHDLSQDVDTEVGKTMYQIKSGADTMVASICDLFKIYGIGSTLKYIGFEDDEITDFAQEWLGQQQNEL